ncbi:Uu.00g007060.m01.CDS01 [Anthostomella pinea]|uniref:Uu.00g007030.m01.CDS01 n=1 Tax=Anthostomella pinea TaxID=933095 RepID=A0AAI8YJ64_9PEZI|nr:Uu.00g007030.m01.CDS01 [Anthostomella pinea]CAJ2506576.1 Uu.00g007060.m01.CDS01 [Anthostomella pinea]
MTNITTAAKTTVPADSSQNEENVSWMVFPMDGGSERDINETESALRELSPDLYASYFRDALIIWIIMAPESKVK